MIWNNGAGPLELEGFHDPETRKTRVVQNVSPLVGGLYEHPVGEFVFHPTHEHWQFEDFTIYELWSLTPTASLDAVAASSSKLSYCIIDTNIIEPENKNFTPRRHYYDCGRSLQGLSAGWGDEYKSSWMGSLSTWWTSMTDFMPFNRLQTRRAFCWNPAIATMQPCST